MVLATSLETPSAVMAGLPSEGTPEAVPVAPATSFLGMLGLVPDLAAAWEQPGGPFAQHADVAAQLAAVGVPAPSADDDEGFFRWGQAIWTLAVADLPRNYGRQPEWRATFGFHPFQLDQTLAALYSPGWIHVLRGRFDQNELRTAWIGSGYRAVTLPGADAYSFAADLTIDIRSVVGRIALNLFNNAAILRDGTVLFASTLDLLRAAVATASGAAPSLAERPEVRGLFAALPESLVTGYLLGGDWLRVPDLDQPGPCSVLGAEGVAARATARAEQAATLGPMPPSRLALVGLTAGGPLMPLDGPSPEPAPSGLVARFEVALLLADRRAAEVAVPIIEHRLAEEASFSTRFPFREIFSAWTVTIQPDEPVVVIELTFAEGRSPDIWLNLLRWGDLGFVAW
jgi:hypothetical protein